MQQSIKRIHIFIEIKVEVLRQKPCTAHVAKYSALTMSYDKKQLQHSQLKTTKSMTNHTSLLCISSIDNFMQVHMLLIYIDE